MILCNMPICSNLFLRLCYTLSLASLSSLQSKERWSIWEEKNLLQLSIQKISKQYPFIERHIQDSKLYSLNSPSAGKKNSITCALNAPEILLPSLRTQPRKAKYTAERCARELKDGTYGSLGQKSSELAPDSKQQHNKNGHNRISTSNFLQIPGNNSLEEKKNPLRFPRSLWVIQSGPTINLQLKRDGFRAIFRSVWFIVFAAGLWT